MGSPYDPVLLSKLYEEERSHQGPLRSLLTRPKQPTLTFRAGPLPVINGRPGTGAVASGWARALVAPLWVVPGTVIAGVEFASALGAWRLALAQALEKQHHSQQLQLKSQQRHGPHYQQQQSVVLNDAVLSAFLRVCRDEVVRAAFLDKWRAACKELRAAQRTSCLPSGCESGGGGSTHQPLPTPALVAAFRRCVLAVAPLLHCATLPPQHISNFAEWSARRAAVADSYCYKPKPGRGWSLLGGSGRGGSSPAAGGTDGSSYATKQRSGAEVRHPVEPLSLLAGGEWLHRPFDVAEVRLEVGRPAAGWVVV